MNCDSTFSGVEGVADEESDDWDSLGGLGFTASNDAFVCLIFDFTGTLFSEDVSESASLLNVASF